LLWIDLYERTPAEERIKRAIVAPDIAIKQILGARLLQQEKRHFTQAPKHAVDEIRSLRGKLACFQPRHPAAVINPPECQVSVTIEAVPAQVGFLESFAAHGLHGYRKIASTCPSSMSMLGPSPPYLVLVGYREVNFLRV
jgi:CRISPR/Cas system type I-B associated protein Csh2 (Cas7 group RAMP superfamily)